MSGTIGNITFEHIVMRAENGVLLSGRTRRIDGIIFRNVSLTVAVIGNTTCTKGSVLVSEGSMTMSMPSTSVSSRARTVGVPMVEKGGGGRGGEEGEDEEGEGKEGGVDGGGGDRGGDEEHVGEGTGCIDYRPAPEPQIVYGATNGFTLEGAAGGVASFEGVGVVFEAPRQGYWAGCYDESPSWDVTGAGACVHG